MKKPELLAPAGNLEKMRIAFEFGADAVYFGLPDFSLRVRINQFGEKEIEKAAKICKELGKKFYVTLNIYAHNRHLKTLPKHLEFIKKIKPDALIVSDPGILRVIRKNLSDLPIHLSTQANTTNIEAVKFWRDQGVERIILAREVTLNEIKEMKRAVPEMELECFVHGAMCMSYSGRCILSKWMTDRSANLGDCAQPCRWRYKTVIDDKKRFEVGLEEDEYGTYFFNSNDMCLIKHLEEVIATGVESLKVEGRAKSVYYVALVTRAYRQVIDAIADFQEKKLSRKDLKLIMDQQEKELQGLSNRGFGTGFLLGDEPDHLTGKAAKDSNGDFVGISEEEITSNKRLVFVHNCLKKGDKIDVITPDGNSEAVVKTIFDGDNEISSAHGGQNKKFEIRFSKEMKGIFLLRR